MRKPRSEFMLRVHRVRKVQALPWAACDKETQAKNVVNAGECLYRPIPGMEFLYLSNLMEPVIVVPKIIKPHLRRVHVYPRLHYVLNMPRVVAVGMRHKAKLNPARLEIESLPDLAPGYTRLDHDGRVAVGEQIAIAAA